MGFGSLLSDIGNALGEAVKETGRGLINAKRTFCRALGNAIQKIGDLFNNDDIVTAGIDLEVDNPYLEKAVDLDDSNTTIQDTIDIHKMCEMVRQDVASQAKIEEDLFVTQIENDINAYIDILAGILPENVLARFDYGISDAFIDDIHNTVSDYVAQNISQDADEFVAILKIDDDTIRKQKTEEYTSMVMKNAVSQLEEKCRYKKNAVYRKMCDDMENYFENEINIMQEYKKNIMEIQRHENDVEYCENQAVSIIKDLSYMECIRTLTYANS